MKKGGRIAKFFDMPADAFGDGVRVTLTRVEQRGQYQIIEFALAGQKVKAIADAATVLRAGDSISLSLRDNRCYFFDAETGARVR